MDEEHRSAVLGGQMEHVYTHPSTEEMNPAICPCPPLPPSLPPQDSPLKTLLTTDPSPVPAHVVRPPLSQPDALSTTSCSSSGDWRKQEITEE